MLHLIYKLSQKVNNGYDFYDSVVVCAESEEDARNIYPAGDSYGEEYIELHSEHEWVKKTQINKIKVELVGKANDNIKRGVILASFNAG